MSGISQTTLATPSKASKPDLDWSQVRETVLMLSATVAQISHSMSEGDESVATLTNSVTEIIEKVRDIGEVTAQLEEGERKQAILANYGAVSDRIREVVVSFQFYDKMVQRLSHVCGGLDELSKLIADESRLFNPSAWNSLQEHIKARFTVETDKVMFDAILNGATLEQALELVENARNAPKPEDKTDIELF